MAIPGGLPVRLEMAIPGGAACKAGIGDPWGTPRMEGEPLEWDGEPLEWDGEPLEWDGEPPRMGWGGIGMGLGWDWHWDWFTPQKANKTENRVFTKNLTKRQFLHIKTNFFTKTGKLDNHHGF